MRRKVIFRILLVDEPHSASRLQQRSFTLSTNQPLNILFIGGKNVGKTTLLNAFANYLSFRTLREAHPARLIVLKPLSFYLGIEGQICTLGNRNYSDPITTSQCQTYTFDPRFNDGKILHLIDTPSLEDAAQPNQTNTAIIQRILNYVNQLSHLNAVCFLVQPDASQLSTTFQTCFGQLINLLGRTVRDNVVFCFTNAYTNFSMPGSTASLLRTMFETYSQNDMAFNPDNTFFFENRSFRYLIAEQNGVVFSNADRELYTGIWSESVKESARLLDYIRQRPVCHIVRK